MQSIDRIESAMLPALDALRLAENQVAEAAESLDRAKTEAADAARRALMEAQSSELLQVAGYVYWNMPDVPAATIAAVVLGNSKAVHKLVAALPEECRPISQCAECGSDIQVRSRSLMAEMRRKNALPRTCEECTRRIEVETRCSWNDEQARGIARLQALRTMPYRDYLTTEEWLETRNWKMKQARFRCQLCNEGGLLNVHHRTYERRGCEDSADLIVLCHPCHAKFHGKLPA